MITEEQVKQFQELEGEKSELEVELRRIDGFNARPEDNKDNERAINKEKIFCKFAGTACHLPIGIFTAELTKRKTAIKTRLGKIVTELADL